MPVRRRYRSATGECGREFLPELWLLPVAALTFSVRQRNGIHAALKSLDWFVISPQVT